MVAAQKRTHQEPIEDDIELLSREGTLPISYASNTTSCCQTADASTFLIRGKQYLQDRKKVLSVTIKYPAGVVHTVKH